MVIQPCPSGQMNMSEYTNVSFSCGPCTDSIDWYMDCSNPHSTRYQYLGGCKKTDCTFQSDSSFRLKATTTETGQLDGVLDIVRVTRNDACRVLCKCYRYYFFYNSSADNGYYLEGNGSCQIFVEGRLQIITTEFNRLLYFFVMLLVTDVKHLELIYSGINLLSKELSHFILQPHTF